MGPDIGFRKANIKYVLLSHRSLKDKYDLAEERLREHEDRSIEIIQPEEQKDKRMEKNKKSFRDLSKMSNVITQV